jgi:quercetin dioxygenase-like cupin family protein
MPPRRVRASLQEKGRTMLKTAIKLAIAACAAAALTFGGAALAQQNLPAAVTQTKGLKRIPLQKFDVPPGERETIMGIAEIAPNTDVARHTHPGPEADYVLEGDLTLMVEGQPPKELKVGDSFNVSAGTVHAARSGANGAKILVVYIVEKGKPLASPAP